MQKQRINWIDSVKCIAATIVFFTHFIASYRSDMGVFWNTKPYMYVLSWITGKTGVVFFSIILGMMAYKAGKRQSTSFAVYSIKRYVYFVCCAIFVNIVQTIYMMCAIHADNSIIHILTSSLLLKDDIWPTFWCMKFFLAGSLISFVNGSFEFGVKECIIEIVVLILLGQTWIAICVMGSAYDGLLSMTTKVLSKFPIRMMLWAGCFALSPTTESDIGFLIKGILALVVLLLIENGNIKALLNNPISAFVGRNCMAFYLIHGITYLTMSNIIFKRFDVKNTAAFWAGGLFIYIVIVLLSVPVGYIINKMADAVWSILPRTEKEKNEDTKR